MTGNPDFDAIERMCVNGANAIADLRHLRIAIDELRDEASAAVDREWAAHGYDSLRFADYRAGWLSLEVGLARLSPTPSTT